MNRYGGESGLGHTGVGGGLVSSSPRHPSPSSLSLVLALLVSFPAFAAEPIPLEGKWDSGVHHLGDRVTLTVRIPIPERSYFITGSLAPGTFWGDTRVAAAEQVAPATIPGDLTLRVTVQPFAVGAIRTTPVPIAVNTAKGRTEYLLTPEALECAGLLPPGGGPPPPIPPLPYPKPTPWHLVLAGLGILLAAGALVRWLLVRTHRLASAPPPPKPQEVDPHRWIREEVERIFRSDSEPRIKYGLLSLRLREYLALRTALPFPDWTTQECARAPALTPLLAGDQGGRLDRNLTLCDLAKFAKHMPKRIEEEAAHRDVLDLLDGLAPTPSDGSKGASK